MHSLKKRNAENLQIRKAEQYYNNAGNYIYDCLIFGKQFSKRSREKPESSKYNRKAHHKGNNLKYQELLCRGWFLPPNTYDCGSFVVNGTAVVGKEQNNPYNRCKSTQKGAELYEISI